MIKRLLIGLFAAGLLILAGTGCNTVRGAGQDIESLGSTIAGSGGD